MRTEVDCQLLCPCCAEVFAPEDAKQCLVCLETYCAGCVYRAICCDCDVELEGEG